MAVRDGKVRTQITFSKELHDRIESYCEEAGISKSAYLSLLAARDLENTDKFLVDFRNELQEVISKLSISEK